MQTTIFLCSYSGFTLCTDLFVLLKVKLTWSTPHLYEQIKYIFLRFGLILYPINLLWPNFNPFNYAEM